MDFKDWLFNEMPLRKAERIGKGWDDPNSKHWWDDKSIRLLQSERGLKKIFNQWKDTAHDYDVYFLKQKGMRDTLETGEVDLNYVHDTLGITDFQNDEDAITVIFTNNRGADRTPMTGWTMAHRFGHALLASERGSWGRNGSYQKFADQIERDFMKLLNMIYGFNGTSMMSYGYGNQNNYRRTEKLMKELMSALGP